MTQSKRVFTVKTPGSTAVKSVFYDEATQTLGVEFPSGEKFLYAKVELWRFQALIDARSIGAYLNTQIKGRYASMNAVDFLMVSALADLLGVK